MQYDVFICHASEDKKSFVGPLAAVLEKERVKVWYDDFSIKMGDSIRREIDKGLSESRFGVVVLSPGFFAKKWTNYELDGLLEKENVDEGKVILPIWHNVTYKDVASYSLPLANRHAAKSKDGLPRIVEEILEVLGRRSAQLEGTEKSSHNWRWCRTSVSSNLTDITFINKFKGWVVGEKGTLLSTSDSGRSWVRHNPGTSLSLNTIVFREDGTLGWIGGERGLLLETRDAGRHWHPIEIDSDASLFFGAMCGGGQAVCFAGGGGAVFRADANGDNWRRLPSQSKENLWAIDFSPSGQIGCIVGANGAVLVSRDGGQTWQCKEAGVRSALYCGTLLPDEQTIWIVGDEGTALVSHDMGENWAPGLHSLPDVTKSWNWLNACYFSPSGVTGWIVGAEGMMLNTKNRGLTWALFHLRDGIELTNVWYQDEETVWCIGNEGSVLSTS